MAQVDDIFGRAEACTSLHRYDSLVTGFVQAHKPQWLKYFVRQGYAEAAPLAAGAEGAVYRLGNGMVAKVWGHRRRPELLLAQRFYADVAAADFPTALIALLQRRTARYGDLPARHVPDFLLRYERVLQKLDAIDRIPTTVVHGDLFSENILVDDGGRPTAVLDFGFLSTAGDPRMDASITALITDMYGPHGPRAFQDHAVIPRMAKGLVMFRLAHRVDSVMS